MNYSNEITVLFNIIKHGHHLISGPAPHYIRVPSDTVDDIHEYLVSSELLKDFINNRIKNCSDNVFLHYSVVQTKETGKIHIKDIIGIKDQSDKIILIESLNSLLLERGFYTLETTGEHIVSIGTAIDNLASSGLTLNEIRDLLKKKLEDKYDSEVIERIIGLI